MPDPQCWARGTAQEGRESRWHTASPLGVSCHCIIQRQLLLWQFCLKLPALKTEPSKQKEHFKPSRKLPRQHACSTHRTHLMGPQRARRPAPTLQGGSPRVRQCLWVPNPPPPVPNHSGQELGPAEHQTCSPAPSRISLCSPPGAALQTEGSASMRRWRCAPLACFSISHSRS